MHMQFERFHAAVHNRVNALIGARIGRPNFAGADVYANSSARNDLVKLFDDGDLNVGDAARDILEKYYVQHA